MAGNAGRKLFTPEAAANFFSRRLINRDAYYAWVVSVLHPDGMICPDCSTALPEDMQERYLDLEQVRCPFCLKKFTAKTGSLLDGAKLDIRDIYLVAVMTHWGVPTNLIAKQVGCHIDTVTNWQAHFQAQQELAGA